MCRSASSCSLLESARNAITSSSTPESTRPVSGLAIDSGIRQPAARSHPRTRPRWLRLASPRLPSASLIRARRAGSRAPTGCGSAPQRKRRRSRGGGRSGPGTDQRSRSTGARRRGSSGSVAWCRTARPAGADQDRPVIRIAMAQRSNIGVPGWAIERVIGQAFGGRHRVSLAARDLDYGLNACTPYLCDVCQPEPFRRGRVRASCGERRPPARSRSGHP